MKNVVKEELPKLSIERSPLVLFVSVVISTLNVYYGYWLLEAVNPWGFLVMIPAAAITFQTLWMLLNPFALVFDDKIEIKQSLFHHKFRYYTDIKKVTETQTGTIYITYMDDEVEPLNLFGVRHSHIPLLKGEIEKGIAGKP